ncbi:MAG: patatin-like phospholipase family protein [Sphingomonadales bacterium]|nr:patatin-like phospholipase family protein [Sphingomonadales bacterium]
MPDEPARPAVRRPKIGLALGSGVARGWAHIGVLRAMEEAGVRPDVVAGTSIGAVVGGAYVTDAMDAVEDWARSLSKVNFFRYLDFRILGGGLFGGKKLADLMTTSFGDVTFEELETPFTAIGCELITGHEIWLNEGPIVPAIHASFALPGVFDPVDYHGRWLVDGALVNPVPVSVCRALGAELVIAVNLAEDIFGRARARREGIIGTGPYGVYSDLVKGPSIGSRKMSNPIIRKLFRHERGGPSLFANMVASLNIVQNRLSRSRLAGDPPDVMIAPKCGHIGLMEFHRADELIRRGEQAFAEAYNSVSDALAMIGYTNDD